MKSLLYNGEELQPLHRLLFRTLSIMSCSVTLYSLAYILCGVKLTTDFYSSQTTITHTCICGHKKQTNQRTSFFQPFPKTLNYTLTNDIRAVIRLHPPATVEHQTPSAAPHSPDQNNGHRRSPKHTNNINLHGSGRRFATHARMHARTCCGGHSRR